MNTITLQWSYPVELDKILIDPRMQDTGIYYITRIFGGRTSDLYIGKTNYSFGSRLQSHRWNWTDQYRGTKQVRLGTIVKPTYIDENRRQELINDVEATLIFCMRDRLLQNIQCLSTCSPTSRLRVINTGFRGNLPEEIYISDEYWIPV